MNGRRKTFQGKYQSIVCTPRRGEGLKDHIENRMTYARLLSDRVSAFSAIADAEKYDHPRLEGIKAQEAAAKADYDVRQIRAV